MDQFLEQLLRTPVCTSHRESNSGAVKFLPPPTKRERTQCRHLRSGGSSQDTTPASELLGEPPEQEVGTPLLVVLPLEDKPRERQCGPKAPARQEGLHPPGQKTNCHPRDRGRPSRKEPRLLAHQNPSFISALRVRI